MKVKPMIFNTEMVKAILSGAKTVTRRPLNVQPSGNDHIALFIVDSTDKKEVGKIKWYDGDSTYGNPIKKPCDKGDLIYVRETFGDCGVRSVYKADDDGASCMVKKWVPSIHMPRNESRLTLKVTNVRIERVQDISEEQAKREGVKNAVWFCPFGSEESEWVNLGGKLNAEYRNGFATVWDSIYQNWDDNHYVWVIEFEVIHKNVDKYLESL